MSWQFSDIWSLNKILNDIRWWWWWWWLGHSCFLWLFVISEKIIDECYDGYIVYRNVSFKKTKRRCANPPVLPQHVFQKIPLPGSEPIHQELHRAPGRNPVEGGWSTCWKWSLTQFAGNLWKWSQICGKFEIYLERIDDLYFFTSSILDV